MLLPETFANDVREATNRKGEFLQKGCLRRKPAQDAVDPHHTHAHNVQLVRLNATNVPKRDTSSLYVDQIKQWQQSKQWMMTAVFWVQ